MSERHCALGNHFSPTRVFQRLSNGKLSRDCDSCKAARNKAIANRKVDLPAQHDFSGVDIDRIHYKLGAVRRKVAA